MAWDGETMSDDPNTGRWVRPENALVAVRRTPASGRPSVVELSRDDDGLVLQSVRGGPRRLRSNDVVEAVRSADTLRTVHAGEITEVWVASQAGYAAQEVADCLRVEVAALEADPGTPWPSEFDSLELEDASPAGEDIGAVPIFLNGERWLPCRVDGYRTPRLLKADPEWPYSLTLMPEIAETWASFAVSESASRTSGVDWWTIGLATSTVLIDVVKRDEERAQVALRRIRRARRMAEIAAWLGNLHFELELDLHMLAVEVLIGGASGEVIGSEFDEDATDSLMCHLELAVSEAEIPAFLRHLARVPAGRAAVDAVRRPRSAAGRRRAERKQRWAEYDVDYC